MKIHPQIQDRSDKIESNRIFNLQLSKFKDMQFSPETKSYLIISAVIFFCCFLGIVTRPTDYLALVWPANATLLALFLRFPNLNNSGGWLGAITAYLFADLFTGNNLLQSLFLTQANLLSTLVSLFFIQYFKINYKYYNTGFTFIQMFGICAFAGCLASAGFAVMTLPNLPNSFMDPESIWIDFALWWTGEMVNYIIFLPLILAFPRTKDIRFYFKNRRQRKYSSTHLLPAIAVVFCLFLTTWFVGPGALLYPLAALIWVALTYRLITVTIINACVLLVAYHNLTGFYSTITNIDTSTTFISLRIGLFMLALSPLILCIISQNRNELFKHVLYLANHDSLTSTMNRHFFFEKGETLIQQPKNMPFSIVMLDIDHFKRLNDQYGHHVGDHVLKHFSELVKKNLRADDLFARIGGEEFVLLLWNTKPPEAHHIAERIREIVQKTPLLLSNGGKVPITVSMGITHQLTPHTEDLQQLINQADLALYEAKHRGRNQIVLAS